MSRRNGRRAWKFPLRRWDQVTELLELVFATGFLQDVRAVNLILYGHPGMGKTELLERWRANPYLSFHSDLTVRALFPILRKAERGELTHLVFTEFQKLFQRKGYVADNCIGTMTMAMEEGITSIDVGPTKQIFDHARFGIVGAMTGRTFRKRREALLEMGFLDRVAFVGFDLTEAETLETIARIDAGNRNDLESCVLERPKVPVLIRFPKPVATTLSKGMLASMARYDMQPKLRILQRLRALAMASAMLAHRRSVIPQDVDRVLQFADYLLPVPTTIDVEDVT